MSDGYPIEVPNVGTAEGDHGSAVRFVQEREFANSVEGHAAQNLVYAWRIVGSEAHARVCEALEILVARHETLRSRFACVNGVVLQVAPAQPHASWVSIDLRRKPTACHEEGIRDAIGDALREPFRLVEAPLVRISLVRVMRDELILVLAAAHAVWDVWSAGVFAGELRELCEASDPTSNLLPALVSSCADFAAYERDVLSPAAVEYWQAQLRGYQSELNLPRRSPEAGLCYQPAEHHFVASAPTVSRRVAGVAQDLRTTPKVVVLTALVVYLGAAGRERDVTVAVAKANRERPELQRILGYLVGADMIRAKLADRDSFATIVQRVHKAVIEAYAHELPAEQQVGVPPTAVHARTPLCDAFFNFVPAEITASSDPSRNGATGWRFARYRTDAEWVKFPTRSPPWGARIDLELWGTTAGAITATLFYDRKTFADTTARRTTDEFARLLAAVASRPASRLGALTRLVNGW